MTNDPSPKPDSPASPIVTIESVLDKLRHATAPSTPAAMNYGFPIQLSQEEACCLINRLAACERERDDFAEQLIAYREGEELAKQQNVMARENKLIAELDTTRAENAWRPIESAPKDGTDILLCWKRRSPLLKTYYAVASWWTNWEIDDEAITGAWVVDSDFALKAWVDDEVHEFPPTYKNPTHWRPLPPPPTEPPK